MSGNLNLLPCPLVRLIGQENAAISTKQIVQALVAKYQPQTAVGDSAIFNVTWPVNGHPGSRVCGILKYRKLHFVLMALEDVSQVGLALVQLDQVTPSRDVFYTLLAIQATQTGFNNHNVEGPCCHFGDGAPTSRIITLQRSSLRPFAHPSRDGLISRVAVKIGNLTISKTSSGLSQGSSMATSVAPSSGNPSTSPPVNASASTSTTSTFGILQQSMPNSQLNSSIQSPSPSSNHQSNSSCSSLWKPSPTNTNTSSGKRTSNGAPERSQCAPGSASSLSSKSIGMNSSAGSSVFSVPSTKSCMNLLNYSSSSNTSAENSGASSGLSFIFKN